MPERDGVNKARRLMALEMYLLNQPGRRWRTSEIAAIFGVSPDTAMRDMTDLSASKRVPLHSSGTMTDFVWHVMEEGRTTLRPLRLDYAQGAALYAALRLLSQQQDDRNDVVRTALIALTSVMPGSLGAHLERIVTGLAQQETPRNLSNIFATLSQGWLGQRVVRLVYEPPHKSRYACSFAPYLLEPSGIGYTMYFWGHSNPPGALRFYKLERILSAELTDETFEIPPDFDGVALLNRAWGVMHGEGELVHIKLRFSPFVTQRVRETRWHPSERVTETPDGLVWEADIGDITEIRPWIRGWGADCEVLEPLDLREGLVNETKRLMRMYGLATRQLQDNGPDQSLLDDIFGD